MKNLLSREPALILALIGAAVTLLVAFGLELSDAQTAAITAFAVAVLGFITRSRVTPSGGA